MKLLNKLTLKSLRLNKVRTIVTIVGIMLSAALITVVSGMALSGRQTMIDGQTEWSGNYDVALDIIDTAKIDKIRQNRNVENAFYKERLGFSKATVADNAEYGYAVTAISENAFDGCFKLKLEKGSFPTNSNEAVVTGAFKNTDGKDVKVGDKITFELGVLKGTDGKVLGESELLDLSPKRFKESKITDKKQKTYTITGIIENPNTRELNNPSSCFEIYTVSDEESPVEAIRTKHMNKLYIAYTPQSEGNYLQNTADILGFKADDMNNVSSDEISPEDQQTSGVNGYSFNTTLLAMKGYGGSEGTNVMIFSLAVIIIIIVMLASVFVIRNSFAISITEKTSMYGMLASVGATKRQIRRNVLFEGFILGLIGIPLGILLGLGVNAILIAILNSVLGDMLSGASFVFVTPTIPIICAIVLSAVTIFLSSFFIALRASRIPPLVAIRGNKDIKVKNNKPYRTSKLTKKLFGVGGEIASKSLKRSRKKYRTTVISIVVSVAMFIAVSAFMDYGMTFTDHYYGNAVMLIVGIFVYGFIGVISLIGLTNIFNTISTNMQLRSKEFASLKSIGMTKKEFNRMIRLESLMYGIKSLIIGIPLGVLGVFAIFSAFSRGNVPMSFVFPWKAILISIAAVFIVVWLIMKYSISKVNKQNIIETIRNDNI